MAPDYYNGYGGGPSGKRRRSLVMRLVDLALTLVTLAVGATMVLTYFVPYVDPGVPLARQVEALTELNSKLAESNREQADELKIARAINLSLRRNARPQRAIWSGRSPLSC